MTEVVVKAPVAGADAPAPDAAAVQLAADKAALAAAQGNSTGGAPVPDGVPAKFWDAATGTVNTEALLKSYSELETAQSKLKTEEKPAQTAEEKAAAEAAAKADEKPVVPEELNGIKEQGVDVDGIAQRYLESGTDATSRALTVEDRTHIKDKLPGVTDAMIDNYMAGVESLADATTKAVYNAAGGEEQWNDMAQWASTSWEPAKVKALNAAMDSGDQAAGILAVQGLRADFVKANGSDPKLIGGDTNNNSGDVYSDWAQVTKDMNGKGYRESPAERKRVEDKLARSNI